MTMFLRGFVRFKFNNKHILPCFSERERKRETSVVSV